VKRTTEPGSGERRRAWISSRGQTIPPILANVDCRSAARKHCGRAESACLAPGYEVNSGSDAPKGFGDCLSKLWMRSQIRHTSPNERQ
jgi:hypothetical protein